MSHKSYGLLLLNLPSSWRMAAMRGTAGSVSGRVALLSILPGSRQGLWKGPALRGRGGGRVGGVDGVKLPHAPLGGRLPAPAVAGLYESDVFGRRIISDANDSLGLTTITTARKNYFNFYSLTIIEHGKISTMTVFIFKNQFQVNFYYCYSVLIRDCNIRFSSYAHMKSILF